MSAPTQDDLAAFLEGVRAHIAKEYERGFVDGMIAIATEAGTPRRPRRPHPHLRLVTS